MVFSVSYFKPDYVILTYNRFLVLSKYLDDYGFSVDIEDGTSDLVRIPFFDAKRLCDFLLLKGFSAYIDRPTFFDYFLYGDYYRFCFSTPDELAFLRASLVEEFGLICSLKFPYDN